MEQELQNISFKEYMQNVKKRMKSNTYNKIRSSTVSKNFKVFSGALSNIDVSIRKIEDNSQEFYNKVSELLLNEVSNPLAELTDTKIFNSLSLVEKQRYVLNLSERYNKTKLQIEQENAG